MITKEITLCGQQVTLGYCYATEIIYKEKSGHDIIDYIKEAVECIGEQRDPDTKNTIFAIQACMLAYCQYNDIKEPVTDKELKNEAKPAEVGVAILTILNLRQQFYEIPEGANPPKNEEKKEGDDNPNE